MTKKPCKACKSKDLCISELRKSLRQLYPEPQDYKTTIKYAQVDFNMDGLNSMASSYIGRRVKDKEGNIIGKITEVSPPPEYEEYQRRQSPDVNVIYNYVVVTVELDVLPISIPLVQFDGEITYYSEQRESKK